MRAITWVLVTLAAASFGSTPAAAKQHHHVVASANLLGSDGAAHGTALLMVTKGRLSLRIDAVGLAPGAHGVHLHSTGLCDAPSFASAGAHLNPSNKLHGSLNPMGSHMGDLPNLLIAANGRGSLSMKMDGSVATLMNQVFDADGTSVVVHADPDDYQTDPSGKSGTRIVCGVFTRTRV